MTEANVILNLDQREFYLQTNCSGGAAAQLLIRKAESTVSADQSREWMAFVWFYNTQGKTIIQQQKW